MIFVVAGNHKEFLEWRKQNRLDSRQCTHVPEGRAEVAFCSYSRCKIVFHGTWKKRTDLKEIEREIKSREFK